MGISVDRRGQTWCRGAPPLTKWKIILEEVSRDLGKLHGPASKGFDTPRPIDTIEKKRAAPEGVDRVTLYFKAPEVAWPWLAGVVVLSFVLFLASIWLATRRSRNASPVECLRN
jgi:hypothetical protein